MTKKEKGFVPVMLTPFKENGAVDFEGLDRITEFYLRSGAKGLFANCLSSELFELTDAEKLKVISRVMKAAGGQVPVVAAGNFGRTLKEQADFIKRVYDTGVQAVIVLTGLLAEEAASDTVLEDAIGRLLSLTGNIPLGFYECPVPYKRIISPQLLGKLVNTGRVIYHKDTCLNIEQVREKNRLCAGKPSFGLYDAYMVHAVASLRSGSAGLSCIQGNFFPELVVWLCKHYDNASLKKEVQLVQQFFIDEMDVMHRNYPKAAKYYLWKNGMNISVYTRESGNSQVSYAIKEDVEKLELRFRDLAEKIPGVLVRAQ
ncbi:dihydrodipicolinate synthase family protein [Niabella beijingensis]|uniref:dihydrodipicolinate synthase family protein n=1 Tax=Niabella beijingensis TaxID=2872700 RepID=UPI001CBB5A25|nr:dihydrodipicolinate synthase family protein [Niabella beijingensis]MBZ4190914.1 dihydrodipicolinate synthase family protein [Niabella beijingensis]